VSSAVRQITDPCYSSPCLGESTCVDLTSSEGGPRFRCECPPDLTGTTCEQPLIEPCSSAPCYFGATYTGTKSAVYDRLTGCRLCSGRLRQQQDAPRRGHCRTRARSRTLSCYFGATCTNVDGGSDYRCRCAAGYQGRNCDWYNPCLTTEPPCRHGATCSSPITGEYSCMCAVGQYKAYA